MIFNFYLFDRKGSCLYHQEWKRLSSNRRSEDGNAKLMFGMLYSLKDFVKRISPTVPYDGFRHYITGSYKLNCVETMTGLKLVLTTDVNVGDIQTDLRGIHKLYIEYALKNACYEPGEPIELDVFKDKLDDYVRKLSYFRL
mmetsp:Transcript_31329/g.82107  ORF Transcript_31329/g.82107 Transcript_31329/m.82107 type:complete len:141 (-) Transcript_31329:132-554(-)